MVHFLELLGFTIFPIIFLGIFLCCRRYKQRHQYKQFQDEPDDDGDGKTLVQQDSLVAQDSVDYTSELVRQSTVINGVGQPAGTAEKSGGRPAARPLFNNVSVDSVEERFRLRHWLSETSLKAKRLTPSWWSPR